MRDRHSPATPSFSVVVPVHNEAAILVERLTRLRRDLSALGLEAEILVVENGSRDATVKLLDQWAQHHDRDFVVWRPQADYGVALETGIFLARHDVILIVNLDWWDVAFIRRALDELAAGADLVLGSKTLPASLDGRSFLRVAITRLFNRVLQIAFGLRASDTHGLKALRRSALRDVLLAVVCRGWLYDTELVLCAERAGVRIVEIPVVVGETRAVAVWGLLRRVPSVLVGLVRLAITLWPRLAGLDETLRLLGRALRAQPLGKRTRKEQR